MRELRMKSRLSMAPAGWSQKRNLAPVFRRVFRYAAIWRRRRSGALRSLAAGPPFILGAVYGPRAARLTARGAISVRAEISLP